MKNTNQPDPCQTACERCDFFDNSHHVKDARTAHAGLCKRWSNITWKTETCSEFLNAGDLGTWNEVIKELHEKPTVNQLNLFQ